MARTRIGISGWRYAPWRGEFYPEGLRQADELVFASRALPSIELNGSFYALQRPESYAAWYDATPPGFMFSVKGNRFITHTRRLRDIDGPLANMFASGVFNLREKLGPFLWQFPPSFWYDAGLVEHFLSLLPHDSDAASALAQHCEPRMKERSLLKTGKKRRLRHAMEIRHDSFIDDRFIALLRKYNVALVVADTTGKWPCLEDVTADFMYLRLHGDKELYAGGYNDAALEHWAQRIRTWSTGGQPRDAHCASADEPRARKTRDVYCYFDNDIKVRAPFDARRLIALLGLEKGLASLTKN